MSRSFNSSPGVQPSTHGAGSSAPPPAALARFAEQAGIRFNGPNPWDIQVKDPALYRPILLQGSLGLGETYMEGLWESERLDETLTRISHQGVDTRPASLE